MTPDARFQFGKNWLQFVEGGLREEQIAAAQEHLLGFLGRSNLQGVRFLDIGCGSGLHSLAASRAGADVVSFDYDSDSVAATRQLAARNTGGARWRIERGDVLDAAYTASLGAFDVVYSWGVLHHTGKLWTAFANAAQCVGPGGQFYLALYASEFYQDPPPAFWLALKQAYVLGDPLLRRALEAWFVLRFNVGRSPKQALGFVKGRVAELVKSGPRGMRFYTDLRDWLGGWPMEFASEDEVAQAAARAQLTVTRTVRGEGNTEFLLRRGNAA